MGYSGSLREKYEEQNKKQIIYNDKLAMLKAHPNYKILDPIEGETIISYVLRNSANLISPPQYAGESYDVECLDIKEALLNYEQELVLHWNKCLYGQSNHPHPIDTYKI